jgi:hypothetical protein
LLKNARSKDEVIHLLREYRSHGEGEIDKDNEKEKKLYDLLLVYHKFE